VKNVLRDKGRREEAPQLVVGRRGKTEILRGTAEETQNGKSFNEPMERKIA